MRTSRLARLDPMFLERWSPRAFLPDSLTEEEVVTLFEAARWSPSCRNEQPWRFVYARSAEDRARFLTALVEANRIWAAHAPLLVLAFASNRFSHNGHPNPWGSFDTGAAWMALALQAGRLGLRCHAMGGFDATLAYEVAGVDPEHFTALCAIAIGRQGPPSQLPEELREREQPSGRKGLEEIAREGWLSPQP